MLRHRARPRQLPSAILLDPKGVERAIEAELAALAEVEADYTREQRRLERWTGPTNVKQHRAKQIAALHRHDREPHVQRLAKLHRQMMTLTAFPVVRTLHRAQFTGGRFGPGF
jgi:hypothetical protein